MDGIGCGWVWSDSHSRHTCVHAARPARARKSVEAPPSPHIPTPLQMDRFRELVSPKKCENKTAASNMTGTTASQNATTQAPTGGAGANFTAGPNVPLAVNGPGAPNATDPATSRRLLSHRDLKRFMLPAPNFGGRSLLAESSESSMEWTPSDDIACTPAAFGQNNRRVQPLNGRQIMRSPDA
eukprot:219836-Chlamydomonas_euryale.AAC.3